MPASKAMAVTTPAVAARDPAGTVSASRAGTTSVGNTSATRLRLTQPMLIPNRVLVERSACAGSGSAATPRSTAGSHLDHAVFGDRVRCVEVGVGSPPHAQPVDELTAQPRRNQRHGNPDDAEQEGHEVWQVGVGALSEPPTRGKQQHDHEVASAVDQAEAL